MSKYVDDRVAEKLADRDKRKQKRLRVLTETDESCAANSQPK